MVPRLAQTSRCHLLSRPLGCLLAICLVVSAAGHVRASDRLSAEGETCSKTADCAEPLRCVASVCTAPKKPAKAAAGSACLRKDDCEDGLRCADKVCVAILPVEASTSDGSGSGAAWPILGVGIGLVVAGIAMIAGGAVAHSDFHDKLDQVFCEGAYTQASGNCEPDINQRSLYAKEADSLETARDVLFGVGATAASLGVAGVIVGAILLGRSKRKNTVSVGPWMRRGELVGLSANVKF